MGRGGGAHGTWQRDWELHRRTPRRACSARRGRQWRSSWAPFVLWPLRCPLPSPQARQPHGLRRRPSLPCLRLSHAAGAARLGPGQPHPVRPDHSPVTEHDPEAGAQPLILRSPLARPEGKGVGVRVQFDQLHSGIAGWGRGVRHTSGPHTEAHGPREFLMELDSMHIDFMPKQGHVLPSTLRAPRSTPCSPRYFCNALHLSISTSSSSPPRPLASIFAYAPSQCR